MSESALEARQDDELGFVIADPEHDDAWLAAEATLDIVEWM